MKSKKGQFFSPLLVFSFVVIIFYAWSTLGAKYQAADKNIGDEQYGLVNTYQGAEMAMFYTDQCAKYALEQSIYDLAQDGAARTYDEDEPINLGQNQDEAKNCEKFEGDNVWVSIKNDNSGNYVKTDCLEEQDIAESLKSTFDEKLNECLLAYPYDIPTENYRYDLSGSMEITGHPLSAMNFDILKPGTIQVAKNPYEIKIKSPPSQAKEQNPKDFSTNTQEPKNTNEQKKEIKEIDGEDFTGAAYCAKGTTCILTKEAYGLLINAQKIAKEEFDGKKLKEMGLKYPCLYDANAPCLVVTSAYRSYERQKDIWEQYAKTYPDESIRRKYVANPDECGDNCPHFTANAVDIVFNGKTAKTMARYEWDILHQIMSKAGWVRYVNEPWHFECCGTLRYQMAKEKGEDAA